MRRGSSAATAIVVLAAVSAWYKEAYLLFVGHGVPSRGGNQSSERHDKKRQEYRDRTIVASKGSGLLQFEVFDGTRLSLVAAHLGRYCEMRAVARLPLKTEASQLPIIVCSGTALQITPGRVPEIPPPLRLSPECGRRGRVAAGGTTSLLSRRLGGCM